jgi:hypothetical protein
MVWPTTVLMQTPRTCTDTPSARFHEEDPPPLVLKRVTWTFPVDDERKNLLVPKTPILKSPKLSTLQATTSKPALGVRSASTPTEGYNLRPRNTRRGSVARSSSTTKTQNQQHKISKISYPGQPRRVSREKASYMSIAKGRNSLLVSPKELDITSPPNNLNMIIPEDLESSSTSNKEDTWSFTQCINGVFEKT